MLYTRRELGRLALAGLPSAACVPEIRLRVRCGARQAGVEVGGRPGRDERPVQLRHGELPQRRRDSRRAACSSASAAWNCECSRWSSSWDRPTRWPPRAAAAARGRAEGGGGRGRGRAGGGRAALTPEQEAAQKAAAEATRKWRLSAPMSKVKEFRKKYNDAGVAIEIVKVDGIFGFTDDVVDYAFELAKQPRRAGAVDGDLEGHRPDGARRPVRRQAQDDDRLPRPHRDRAGAVGGGLRPREVQRGEPRHRPFHRRPQDVPDTVLEAAPRSDHAHPRQGQDAGRRERAVRQGDTPIKEALRVIRDNKWKIQATIEFEYPVPEGSDRMTELAKSLQYCKDALLT